MSRRWTGSCLQSLDVVSYIPEDYFASLSEYMVWASCDVVAESGGQVVPQKEESLIYYPCSWASNNAVLWRCGRFYVWQKCIAMEVDSVVACAASKDSGENCSMPKSESI